MIFSLLYSLPIMSNNKNKYIYTYAMSSIMYVVIHWFLFSRTFNNSLIQRYKYGLYLIAALDFLYVHMRLKTISDTHDEETPIHDKQHMSPSDIKDTRHDTKKHTKETDEKEYNSKQNEFKSEHSEPKNTQTHESNNDMNVNVDNENTTADNRGVNEDVSQQTIPVYKAS